MDSLTKERSLTRPSPSRSSTPSARPALEHLYVHVPFCARRCSYCDFSIAVRATTPVDEYIVSLKHELAQHDTSNWNLTTVYFGGGTPSRLGGDGIARVLELIQTNAIIREGAEITIEANPDDTSLESATRWRNAGVNRVSLGVQSFDASVLQWMHRTHTARQSIHAVETLQAVGIPNISVDLIFALPASLNRDWSADVRHAISLAPSHISLYGLTVEPHTPLARWKERGEVEEASEDRYEQDFLFAHTALAAAGFDHYEVSNYGRPGFYSRHNSAYWSNVPYAALGPSAHAFDGTRRCWNVSAYTEWVTRLSQNESPEAGAETLTPENRAAERVYLDYGHAGGSPQPTLNWPPLALGWMPGGRPLRIEQLF
jgi:oxygen-independent coproporphyrinogen-3 oxidase